MLSMQEAAKRAGVGRSTLYRKAAQGLLSITDMPDGSRKVDTAELYRVFPPDTPQDAPQDAQREKTDKSMDMELVRLRVENEKLQEALREAKERESSLKAEVRETLSKAEGRERWLQQQVETLTSVVRLIEHRPNDAAPQVAPDPAPAVIKRPWWRFWG